eukprot:953668-Ditylum_brightwellii.AAC.1
MLRRDISGNKGHGTVPVSDAEPSYQSTTIWKDRASFDKWREGSAFKRAHGQTAGGDKPAEKPQPPAP